MYPLGDGGAGAVYLVDDRSVDYRRVVGVAGAGGAGQRLLESSPGDGLTLMNLESGGPPFRAKAARTIRRWMIRPPGGWGTGRMICGWKSLRRDQPRFPAIHTPASDGEYDLFCTTNLSPHGRA